MRRPTSPFSKNNWRNNTDCTTHPDGIVEWATTKSASRGGGSGGGSGSAAASGVGGDRGGEGGADALAELVARLSVEARPHRRKPQSKGPHFIIISLNFI